MKNKAVSHGFSLVELSIVLVILGLLVGGVLGGQALIRAAELRSVSQELEQYTTAVNAFRTKYHGLPGDLKNATQFWGAEPAANCPGDETTPSTTQATCDGNGNGNISWDGDPGFGGEAHRFWQHLSNAGLIAGTYTGTHAAGACNTNGNCNVELGVTAPASKLGGAGWSVAFLGSVATGHHYHYEGDYGNVFYFGTVRNYTSDPALLPEEAWNIDTKVDDGRPGAGRLHSWLSSYSTNCADSDDPDEAMYQLDVDTVACQFVIKSGF